MHFANYNHANRQIQINFVFCFYFQSELHPKLLYIENIIEFQAMKLEISPSIELQTTPNSERRRTHRSKKINGGPLTLWMSSK